jgi:predicted transcriptional regulator
MRKNGQMGLREIKKFCTTKEMVSKLKRLPTKWKKILQNISNKGLFTRIYRELKKLNSKKKINDSMKKWANELNRAFSKEEVQMAKKKTRRNAQHPWL